MKISCIVGARPQFIKIAALARKMKEPPVIIHTGQHYQDNMSGVFFEEMRIPKPKYHLGIGGVSQGAMTGRMIEEIEKILVLNRPDWVIVFGDTNSTLAGAIAASKLHIPLAHVEAGLRSYNRKMPEEINRVLTDHCSDVLFTPTEQASKNLEGEGVALGKIHQVGDIMFDAVRYYQEQIADERQEGEYVLATIHRAENTDDPKRLREVFEQLFALAKEVKVIMPLHPRTRNALDSIGFLETCQTALHVVDPVGYLDMIRLESGAQLIVTDSGGVQKEAFFFRVPCITMRKETEWVELVDYGFNRLVSSGGGESLLNAYYEMLDRAYLWEMPLYGDGNAAERIIKTISQSFAISSTDC